MTTDSIALSRRLERIALVLAILAGVVAALLAWRSPDALAPAWRLGVFVCLQPALGSLIFLLIHRLTGGQWLHGLAPYLYAGTRLLPWVWILTLPLAFGPIAGRPVDAPAATDARAIAPGAARPASRLNRDEGVASSQYPVSAPHDAGAALARAFAASGRELGDRLRWYFSRPMLVGRAGVYAIAFFLLMLGARRAVRSDRGMGWFGPLGLIALVFLLHLLATDWVIMLDPGWFSTGFPLIWIVAQAIAGIALAVGAAVVFGANPAERGAAKHVRGLDWGNLMLAAMMVWSYVAFVQLLIIWSGNLPSETAWYRHRAAGGWRTLAVTVAIVEFGAPLLLLLSRALKRRRRGLGAISLLLLAGQLGYTIWLIGPAFPDATSHAPWLLVAMVAAALALFVNRYVAIARGIQGRAATS